MVEVGNIKIIKIDFHDRRKCTYDRLRDFEIPSSSIDSTTKRVDQILDDIDIGECEMSWEER